jgi:phenylpyruvate tautomerase PptA (4-oxalocrotonate tautomerase family)
MPIVRIDYEKEKLSKEQMRTIATKLQGLTAQAIGYELTDISVFASENQITIFADSVVLFKKEQGIEMPFNLSIVKMNWKFKLEI